MMGRLGIRLACHGLERRFERPRRNDLAVIERHQCQWRGGGLIAPRDPSRETGEEKLEKLGLMTYEQDGKVLIDSVTFGSPAAELGLQFDQEILAVRAPTDRVAKEWMWLPALLLFALVVWMQRRRKRE